MARNDVATTLPIANITGILRQNPDGRRQKPSGQGTP
jgi:hypothetical protein